MCKHAFALIALAVLSVPLGAQVWVPRAERPEMDVILFADGAPDGGPLLLENATKLSAWNGQGWRPITTLPPGAITPFDFVCDRARGRTVALVLTSFVPNTAGTAEWDGQTWTLLPGPPPSGYLVNMCYDPALGAVLMLTQPVFGTSSTQDFQWTGSSWSALPANVRPRHVGDNMAPDLLRSRLVAVATNPTTQVAETYEWNVVSWNLLAPAVSPPTRQSAAMAFDPMANKVMLFGGYAATVLQDTWHWDGVTWSPAPGATVPVVTPYPQLALDRVHGALMLLDRGSIGDRDFLWTGSAWTAMPISPPASGAYLTANDPLRGQLVRYVDPFTYTWDGAVWTRAATGGPGPRSTAMALDVGLAELVVFGGWDLQQSVLGDTWGWNGAQWTQHQTPVAPPRRAWHALVAYPTSASVILFGGQDPSASDLDDTWQWQSGAWTNLSPGITVRPPAGQCLGASRLTGDPMVLAGGQLWQRNGAWNLLTTSPIPMFRATALGFTGAGDPLLTSGYLPGGRTSHEFVGGVWQPVPQPTDIDALATDPLRGGVIGFDRGEMFAYTATPAGNATLGTGCGAPAPALWSGGVPRIGNLAHRVHVDGLSGLALIAFDLVQMTTPLGAGCSLHLATPTTFGIVTANAFGLASLPLPLPNAPALRGLDLFVQAAGPQPGGPYLGLAVSPALRITLGD